MRLLFICLVIALLGQVCLLTFPVALQMLLQALLGMADVAMVAHLGQAAVAAVGLSAKMHFLIMVLMIGVATAGGVLIAQHMGAKDVLGVKRTLAITLLLGVLIALPLVCLFAVSRVWVTNINPDAEVSRLTSGYLMITAPTLLFVQLVLIYEAALRSVKNVNVPLLTGGIAVFLNIFFNYVFIFGEFGAPQMGVLGAAWGTLLARVIQAILVIGWVYMGQANLALSVTEWLSSVKLARLIEFTRFSLPMVANYGVWGLGNTVYHVLMGFSGTQALAVMGVMVPVESAFFALFIGVASACSVMVGQALGSDNFVQARMLQRYFLRLTLILVAVVAAVLFLSRDALLTFFRLSGEAKSLLSSAIVVFCIFSVFKVGNLLIIIGVLRAGGDNKYCLVVDTIVMWLIGLPIFAVCVAANVPFLILYALLSLEDVVKLSRI